MPTDFIHGIGRPVEVKFVTDRACCSNIERDSLILFYHLHKWLSYRAPDGQLVKHIWVMSRQVGNDQRAFDDPFDYLGGNDAGLSYFVGPNRLEPETQRHRPNYVPQDLVGIFADGGPGFADRSNKETDLVVGMGRRFPLESSSEPGWVRPCGQTRMGMNDYHKMLEEIYDNSGPMSSSPLRPHCGVSVIDRRLIALR